MTRQYIPALDGLRALAIGLVFAFHLNIIYFGWLGVQLFFVLSGFLITQILVADARKLRGAPFFSRFYMRRTLRIFPLYFLFVGVIVLFGEALIAPGDTPYLLTYTYNIRRLSDDYVYSAIYGHLWSLAVEEQFYLVWPLLVYFLGERVFRRWVIALIVLFPVARISLHIGFGGDPAMRSELVAQSYFQTFSQAEAFAWGAAAALFGSQLGRLKSLLWVPGLLCVSALAVFAELSAYESVQVAIRRLGLPSAFDLGPTYFLGYTATSCLFAAMVLRCLEPGWLSTLLSWKPVVWVGAVSYGIYVYHYPIIALCTSYFSPADHDGVMPILGVIVSLLLTLLVAAASFYFFEKPFLKLKRYWA